MQQLSRTCLVAGHQQKVIEYVCIYPQCEQSRFICSKCALEDFHQHNQQGKAHIVDNNDFYVKIKNKLKNLNDYQQMRMYDLEKSVSRLKIIIQQIQNLVKNLQNILLQVENGEFQNINVLNLENQVLNVQQHGFDQLDDNTLNKLIKELQEEHDIYQQLDNQSNLIIQSATQIKDWRLSQAYNHEKSVLQQICNAKYQIQKIDKTVHENIRSGAISNDLKYIITGRKDKLIKIWDYETNNHIKQIQLTSYVTSCKFTDDSTLLYAGSMKQLYLFDVQSQFKELYKQIIHEDFITIIYCISNTIIITASKKTIIKTDVNLKQQLLQIQAHNDNIYGLDYNNHLNIIASGSEDKSIKLWNGKDKSLILEKQNAHNNRYILQVLFLFNIEQLISLDNNGNLIIWNINYDQKQLEQLQFIENCGKNISLVKNSQYIITTGEKFIKVYAISGEFIRQFDHEVKDFWFFNTIQINTMKAVLIQGYNKLQVCKIDME